MSKLQKFALRLTILAFAVAAAMGIAALLIGEFGDLQAKVLLTTLSIGLMSLAMLCYLSPRQPRFIQLGIIGFITAITTLAIALFLIWNENLWQNNELYEMLFKSFGILLTVSATIAQICMLAAMTSPERPVAKWLFRFTILMATVFAVMVIIIILSENADSEWFIRSMGVVAILDAFGTVALIAIRIFTGSPSSAQHKASINAYTQRLINEAAEERGVSAQQILDEAINKYVTNATESSQAPSRSFD